VHRCSPRLLDRTESVRVVPNDREEVDEGEPSLPTILFDEVDSVFNGKGETNEMLRGILNGGYRQGATIPRTDISGKRPRVERWPIFAPVALAALARCRTRSCRVPS
jgi:hypothetical protein